MGRFAVKEINQIAQKLLWIVVFCCSLPVQSAEKIKSINFKGNLVTQASVLERELYIQPGDFPDLQKIEKSRQAIMDLDLFKSVSFLIDEVDNNQAEEKSSTFVDVTFVVEEKYYLIVLPRARSDDDEFHYGMQMRWDNFQGLNHSVRLLVEDRGETRRVEEQRSSFSYLYPNVNDSSFNINIEWQKINEVDLSDGVIDRQDDIYGVAISRWLNKQGRNKGWLIGGSVNYQDRYNDVISGEQFSNQLDAIAIGFEVAYNSVSNFDFNRGGKAYSYRIDISDERFGSDTEYTRHLLTYRSYYRVGDNPLSNLNVQTRLGHSNDMILGKFAFSLGSSDDLRGYENDRFNGNTVLLTNVEYMFPHPGYPIVRYVYFADIGNTYDAFKDMFHEQLHVGVGFGLRWKIRAFVKLDLRADIGYGITDEDYQFSFGTRHAF